jgi:DNA polymerase-3 subunit delta
LLRSLARDPLHPVYLLYGDEPYLVDQARHVIVERLAAGAGALRVHAGDEDVVLRVGEALRTRSLFGGLPLAIVRDVDALGEAEQEGLLACLPETPDAVLVLVGSGPDLRRRLFATCVRRGAAFEFGRIPLARLPAWLIEEARMRGHALSADAAQLLVDLIGSDLRVATAEIEKLSLYVGAAQPIDAAAAAAVVGSSRERSMFELADHLQRRDVGPALGVLRALLAHGGAQPIAVAAFLGGQFRRMLAAAELIAAGVSSQDMARGLGVSPWVADRIGAGARRYGRRALVSALERLAAVDLALKSSRTSATVLLESYVIGLRSPAVRTSHAGR